MIQWILDILKKNRLYTNLKKCCFHKDKIYFLSYVILAQTISIEDKRIKAVRNWPKLKLIRVNQIFLKFANLYYYFIQDFNKIARPITLRLKTVNLSKNSLVSMNIVKKDEVIDNDVRSNRLGQNLSKLKKIKNLAKSKKLKNQFV